MKAYHDIFFTWCVPGLILVIFGRLAAHPALIHFGISLLSIGCVYYGKIKRHRRAWSVAWQALSVVYLILGLAELLRF